MRVDTAVDRWAPACHVYLDGQLLPHCLVADEALGCAEVIDFDPSAPGQRRFQADPTCPRGYRTRMLWGVVALRFPEAPASEGKRPSALEEQQ